MKIHYSRRFLKQLTKIPFSTSNKIEQFIFDELPTIAQIELSGKIEKMKGYDGYYKVRFGSYRIGMYYQEDTLHIKLVMNRKDIYNYFP